jgi:sugar phosphate isomerase/epimerase
MVYTPPVDSLQRAWGVVRSIDEPNLGLLIDAWQWARAAESAESLHNIPSNRITSVQLSDKRSPSMQDVIQESRHFRCIPGDGTLDLPAFLWLLLDRGVTAPLSVEVMSDALDTLPAVQAALAVARGSRKVLRQLQEQFTRNPLGDTFTSKSAA